MVLAAQGEDVVLAGEIGTSFCASLETARGYAAPFPHFRASHLFPPAVLEALAELPLPVSSPAYGRRECQETRLYFDAARIAGNRLIHAVAEALRSPMVTAAISSLCGAALDGTYLRIEYAIDADGFWLEPHTDLGVKKFTGLIALSGGAGKALKLRAEDPGTDLYRSPAEPYGRVPFEPNAGTLFVPGPATWHGFAPRPIQGLRKSLILNYVGPEWRSRDQLAFPDRPIG